MESPKICPICHKPCLSNFSIIFQKGADVSIKLGRLKNDNFTVRPGMHVHVSCRKNYIRTPGVPSSSAEVSYRKPRTSSGGFIFRKDCFYCSCVITEREKKTKKSCNISCKNQEVDKAVHEDIFDIKDDEWSIEVKGRYACVNDLRTEDAVYHIQCSSHFQIGKGNPKKRAMPRKRGRDTTAEKERVFLEIVEHIDSH